MRLFIATLIACIIIPAIADEAKPVAVIEPADAQELSRILNHETPPTWGQPIAQWFNILVARETERQKAKEAEKK